MEEEVGVKVTRLRRRLSVETEDVKSPATQSTPTKKRGGRLAAKPQLELIDENATEADKPKRTRKSAARDAEPDEKAITPSRRSTRIRSNTSIMSENPVETEDKGTPSRRSTRTRSNASIVSETPADIEDKGTPARRNARIKSNTSILSDSVQYSESPRAKRAARRTSQVGSDNEAPITPARQTRRTRKDSTSSIDKQVEPTAGKLGTQVNEVIVEETENSVKETKGKKTPVKDQTEVVRKSPRLIEKTQKPTSVDSDNKENEYENDKESIEEKLDVIDGSRKLSTSKVDDECAPIASEVNLSVSTVELLNGLDKKPKKAKFCLNKTTSAIEESFQLKSKRNRTKSWTTITLNTSDNTNFLSDSEVTKKKSKRNSNAHNLSNISSTKDNVMNISNKKEKDDIKEVSLNSSKISDNVNKQINKSLLDTGIQKETVEKVDKSMAEVKESPSKINIIDNKSQKNDTNLTEKFFGEAPTGPIQSLVFIEDSDSNSVASENENLSKQLDTDDQTVPVVEHRLINEIKELKSNLSCEPMDIDETIPENVTLSEFTDQNNKTQPRKSFLNISQVSNASVDNIVNKSHRKSVSLEDDNPFQKSNKRKSFTDNTTEKSFNKSSIVTINIDETDSAEENMGKKLNKSPRKSTLLKDDSENTLDKLNKRKSLTTHDNSNNTMEKSLNKSVILAMDTDETDSNSNKSIRMSIAEESMSKKLNKSKRKSSVSNTITEDDKVPSSSTIEPENCDTKNNLDKTQSELAIADKSFGKQSKSKRKSSISNTLNSSNINGSNGTTSNEVNYDETIKSKIASDINDDSISKNKNTSLKDSLMTNIADDDETESSLNKLTPTNTSITLNKSKRKSSSNNTDVSNRKSLEKDKSRKSSISSLDIENPHQSILDESSNKSKRKSLTSQTLDKSSSNKSTLVLSQIKDTSETSVPKDIYEFDESKDSNEQLSKSVNVPNANKDKESDKKNMSLTYSTSTPLQQKTLKKLGMQINSSIIAPNSATKSENKVSLNKSKKETSVLSRNDEVSESSDDEDSEEEESMDKSNMIDDEAAEASDDYQSGDSRDQDERDYEDENEILEKGETLDSDDEDFEDESDYEKDSFVVDSEPEDYELLSGSEDLSMSADELSMSAKSKQKFNARKVKEQKKASREMFEARHKLNESDKSDKPKSKKLNRKRLESSESESEEEINAQPKKNRRARIDSSQDVSIAQSDVDTSVSKKKKKVKRLSASVCEEDGTNENEISLRENNDNENSDPLSLQNIVKVEPKTPQKELNISTVAVMNMEVEEVEVDENVSIMKSNQTSDPLQATMAEDDEDSEASISENEEITQNYESVLNNLNKATKNVKSLDMSLNLNKKKKEKTKEPIVDQLNLTQVKKTKNKNNSSVQSSMPKQKSIIDPEEESSDSIDMKLLFNEDTGSGSETTVTEEKDKNKTVIEDFIPLKRTDGSTNILQNETTGKNENEPVLNVSKSKKNKRKSQSEDTTTMQNQIDDDLNFFIDTTGTHSNSDQHENNTSIKGSAKKNKQKNNVSFANTEEAINDEDSNDAPIEVSYHSEKKKNRSKLDLNSTQNDESKINVTVTETPNQSAKKKKNNKKSLDTSHMGTEEQNNTKTDDQTNDVPTENSEQSNKGESIINENGDTKLNTTATETPSQSGQRKKKNKKGLNSSQIIANDQNMNVADDQTNEVPTEISQSSNELNMSKDGLNNTLNEDTKVNNTVTPSQSAKKKKNKKNLNNSQIVDEVVTITDNVADSIDTSQASSGKKKKNKLSVSHVEEIEKEAPIKAILNISTDAAKKQKQKEELPTGVTEKKTSKKRKRKPSADPPVEEMIEKDGNVLDIPAVNESVISTNQKKKQKTSNNDDNKALEVPGDNPEKQQLNNVKKKNNMPQEQNAESTKKSKKRKDRDDDDDDKISKVIKQNSLDKVRIPRLPTNVLKQLDDTPKKEEVKSKIISTASFKVEEIRKRRTKPSNYLEESVYLNDSIEEQPKKSLLKKPKVLPFIPTASTSGYGFTTTFKVNVIPRETQFVAQSSNIANFKTEHLEKNRIKKLGTFEKYKRHRNIKIAKF